MFECYCCFTTSSTEEAHDHAWGEHPDECYLCPDYQVRHEPVAIHDYVIREPVGYCTVQYPEWCPQVRRMEVDHGRMEVDHD